MSNAPALKKILEESIRIQVSAFFNLKELCVQSPDLALGIYGISDVDLKAILEADNLTLQKVAHYHNIFSCQHLPRAGIKELIEAQEDGALNLSNIAHATSIG